MKNLQFFALLSLFPLALVAPAQGQTVVAHIHQPFGLSIDPSGNLWVEQYNDATIDVVSPAANAVIKALPVAPQPTQPAFSQGLAIYSSEYGKAVYALDVGSYKVRYTIPVASPAIANVVIGPDGRGYIASDPGAVTIFDPANGAILGAIATSAHPRGVAFSADGATMAVGSRGASAVDLIDVAAAKVRRTVAVGSSPRAVAVVGETAYTANSGDNTVSAVDIATGEVRATIPVGQRPRRLAASGARLFVSNEGENSISVIDTKTNAVAQTIDVGASPRNMAVNAKGTLLFVAGFGADEVLAFDIGAAGK